MMDSEFMNRKSCGLMSLGRGTFFHRDESVHAKARSWLSLVSSKILLVFLYSILFIKPTQTSPSEEAYFGKIGTLAPDPNVKYSSRWCPIVSSSCTASIFQPVRVRSPIFTSFHAASPLQTFCIDHNSRTQSFMRLVAASLHDQCQEIDIQRILARRRKTSPDFLRVLCSGNTINISRALEKICRSKSIRKLQVEIFRRHSRKRSSCTVRKSRIHHGTDSSNKELLCGHSGRQLQDLHIDLHMSSIPNRQVPRPGSSRDENTAAGHFPGSDVEWVHRVGVTPSAKIRRTASCRRYLSVKLGERRLRRILAEQSTQSSSGLHGKWRAIVIADTVIGMLGFLIAVTALSCCMRRRGATMRCWWNFSCDVGGTPDLTRDFPDLPDIESSPATSRPMPPMSSPALCDLRQSLPDFRAISRHDSGDSRSRRSQTGSGHLLYGAEAFSFETLAAAAGGFADENKIGAGSFGVVYRGVLFDGRVVAIKRADRGNARKIEENESAFEAELEVLSRLHHKYLVNLVGYCDDQDERLLVYEYMSNGTLHDHLHRHRSIALSSWQARIRVALQAARGIEYLHTYASRQIIHRDIKSANILLDTKWNARVSDFGLSLISQMEELSASHLSTGAAGTLGYMDPEYYRLQHLTTKSDVYSFGVVLMELLTGKKAIHRRNTFGANVSPSDVNVVDYAVPPIRADELLSILDSRLRAPEESQNAAVEIMAEVAEQCVRLEGKDRPTMAEIVGRLETAYALSHASETSLTREFDSSASSQIGPSRQLDSSKLPLGRQKGESLELGVSSTILESHEQDSGTQPALDGSQESSSHESPKDNTVTESEANDN